MLVIGSDHGGFELKQVIIQYLEEHGIQYEDEGTYYKETCAYPDIAKKVCKKIVNREATRGVLICRSGYGMSITANKFKGIRCVPATTEELAKLSRMHNDTNVLALGADYLDYGEAIRILRIWLATPFEGGRHLERLQMIEEIEKENMK